MGTFGHQHGGKAALSPCKEMPAKAAKQREGKLLSLCSKQFCTHTGKKKRKKRKNKKGTLGKQKMNLLIRDKWLALHFRGKQRFLDAWYWCSSDISCWKMCWVRGKQSMAGIARMLMCCFGFSKWKVLFVLEFVLKWFFFPGTARTLPLLYSYPCFPADTHPFSPP